MKGLESSEQKKISFVFFFSQLLHFIFIENAFFFLYRGGLGNPWYDHFSIKESLHLLFQILVVTASPIVTMHREPFLFFNTPGLNNPECQVHCVLETFLHSQGERTTFFFRTFFFFFFLSTRYSRSYGFVFQVNFLYHPLSTSQG